MMRCIDSGSGMCGCALRFPRRVVESSTSTWPGSSPDPRHRHHLARIGISNAILPLHCRACNSQGAADGGQWAGSMARRTSRPPIGEAGCEAAKSRPVLAYMRAMVGRARADKTTTLHILMRFWKASPGESFLSPSRRLRLDARRPHCMAMAVYPGGYHECCLALLPSVLCPRHRKAASETPLLRPR